MHSTEKACDTTLDDEKYDVRYTPRRKLWRPLHSTTTNRTSVLVTALCNQPEAFASVLDDDQSRYLHLKCWVVVSQHSCILCWLNAVHDLYMCNSLIFIPSVLDSSAVLSRETAGENPVEKLARLSGVRDCSRFREPCGGSFWALCYRLCVVRGILDEGTVCFLSALIFSRLHWFVKLISCGVFAVIAL